jgi:hypothetical protein
MKKTIRKMELHRETLRWLTGGVADVHPGLNPGVSVPSCIDGCPSAMCPTTSVPGIGE